MQQPSPSLSSSTENATWLLGSSRPPSTAPVTRDPLEDGLLFMALAAQALSQDEFSKCFESKPRYQPHQNNFTYALWLLGVFIRYGIFFPIRLGILCFSMMIFISLFAIVHGLDLREEYKQKLFSLGCKLWLFAFGALVQHHGRKERQEKAHIYVANHTSFTDYFLLSSHRFPHAALAQVHGGLFGILQKYLLSALGSLAFNRDEQRDRIIVSERMKAHSACLGKAPLLVFPEGTCVNNEATVLFHKGAFELGAAILPVAIKYNKRLLDPYWNTREQTFSQHVLYLMTRWLMIVDVWWLPLQEIQPGESAIDFSNRVKAMISEAAGLTNLSWDGYMKNYMKAASRDKLLFHMQRQYAATLKNDLRVIDKSTSDPSFPEEAALWHSRKQRSMSAVTIDELERRSTSPLQQLFVFPEWLSEQALVDIKNAIMNRRFNPSTLSGSNRRLSDGEDNPHPEGSDAVVTSPTIKKNK